MWLKPPHTMRMPLRIKKLDGIFFRAYSSYYAFVLKGGFVVSIYCFKSAQFLKACLVTTINEFGEILNVHEDQNLQKAKEYSVNQRSKSFYDRIYPNGCTLTWIDNLSDQSFIKAVKNYELANQIPFRGRISCVVKLWIVLLELMELLSEQS